MTTCAAMDARLERYLAGQLSSAESEALEIHAVECDRCGPLLEVRSRLDVHLARERTPDPMHREHVMRRVQARQRSARRRPWWIPVAMAASALLVFGIMRPDVKSGQRPVVDGSPAAIAAERADGEFRHLDAARAELRDAIARTPDDPTLHRALERLDAQRRSLENLIREFES